MSQQTSNIVIAVDAELQVLERRINSLQEIRRLAIELDHARLPKAATGARDESTRKRPTRTQSAPLSVAEVIDVARDVLVDGPATIGKILDQLGRSRTPRAAAAVKDALAQLGATVQGRARGGGDLYALPVESDEGADGDIDRGEVAEKVRELAETAVGWSDEEFQYQLRKRCGIDASLAEIGAARNGAAA